MGLGMSDGWESGHDADRWKILNFSKIQILGIQSDLKEARGLERGYLPQRLLLEN
jgi:hypothetical protein